MKDFPEYLQKTDFFFSDGGRVYYMTAFSIHKRVLVGRRRGQSHLKISGDSRILNQNNRSK